MPPEESSLAMEDTGTSDRFDSILDTSSEQDDSSTEDTAEYPEDGQVSEESFTSVDPKTLSPELQAQYKNLQRDYTRKQQAAAEKVRQYETQLAEHQRQVQQYQTWAQQIQPILQQYQQAQQGQKPAAEQAPDYSAMTPEQILQHEVDARLKTALTPYNEALQQANQRVAQIEQARAVDQLKQAYTAQVSEAFSEHGEDSVRQRSDEITKLIQQIPQLTVSQAYAILTYKQAKTDGAKTVQNSLEAKRRAASIFKPTSRAEPASKLEDTGDPFENAKLEAKAELARR